jgi:squalene-hopene/tetraprenyl-beta-curcumene cyclase
MSPAKSAEYLDGVALFWMRTNSCGACHANFAYVMAGPHLGERSGPVLAETRHFLENRKENPRFSFTQEAVGVAFALAWDDARTGKLRPTTREALRRMWTLQRPDSTWGRMGCGELMPSENDRHYTVVLAALAAGVAPEGYARSAEAQDGLTRLRRYFARFSPRHPHDQALTLWASLHLDGLMTSAERKDTIQSLLARQGKDGGWSLSALSVAAMPKSRAAPSDGYGTAFTIFLLRQAGVPATQAEIGRGVDWLLSNQRVSGRWFTPTHTEGERTEGGVGARDLYVQNLGSAFTVLALKACAESTPAVAPRASAGLSLRGRRLLLD